ncbi:non-ribosomal peptide synthetase [Mycobacterium sp. 1274756.6]|uniref:non-ribosomal peptide synthetase n=1 Tax=Mycobacterium sp. 1274756.6 TaxID=1834076 RepID=UPI000800FE92|nr:non-ribosomal peptide synthetase [Mycobacterium sp. 1274756.6]OBJ72907.1 non-ribosomal peptide synthetase [Mycobacterium sp. 1274756.6]
MAVEADTVAARRRALLKQRIAESGLTPKQSPERRAVHTGHRYPLSPGQRRMWFLQTLDPTDTTLNICIAYRLTGPLAPDRLHAALNSLVARHSVLRTRYGADDAGEPFQQVDAEAEVTWRRHDLTDLPATEQADRIDALAHAEFARPFDPAADVPIRATLIRTGDDDHTLVLVVHHICWDDDSWPVFFAEVNAAYRGAPRDEEAADYIAATVLSPALEPSRADVDYWRSALLPLPEPPELPGPAVHAPSRRARQRSREVPADLLARIESYAREHAATPFMVFLTAFGALMRRYSGAHDLVIAVPVVDRSATSTGAIGYFGNTVLLRLPAGPDATFAELVDSTREICAAGFAHQAVGIERVVQEINPDRAAGRDGLDQVTRLGFSMRGGADGFDFAGIDVRPLRLGAPTAQLPLALAVAQEAGRTRLEFEYQSDMLSDPLVDQLLEHYAVLLDAALHAPNRRVAGLDLLSPPEWQEFLHRSRGTQAPTAATTMVELLEATASTRPEALAVVSDREQLTYAELHRRANRLARWLIGKGAGPENIIGLQLNGSVEFVVAVLAVWKAGAAYLPIDPAYPDARIDYLIADTDPYMVISREGLAAAEAAAAELPDTPLSDAERVRPLRPANLAYVIYTSGSTGRPKGVAVAHEAIAEHIDGFLAEWQMTSDDRMLQSSSVSFDASLADLFLTLALGARLVVPEPGRATDVDYIAELIERHGVTVLHMVPAMLTTLLQLPQADRWRQLRQVPVGGEALPGTVADDFTRRFPAALRNHYGPTEAVVCSTHKPVTYPAGHTVVPIGTPNRNVDAYVLDAQLQPTPPDVVGELYLGGNQLARGYLGRADLTAQRFIADPFRPGARLYRTGDLVRRNRSGELEFVGRADEQVKLRGYRIELGEIEAVLASHPAVERCMVVTDGTGPSPQLVAYLVPAGQLDVDELRDHVATQLPAYMVPSAFAIIPQIPLTVHGKLDREALPAPTRSAAAEYRAPVTATERRICALFGNLFDGGEVGAHDSFFELGGHSLLAARLVAQIRAEFGLELPVRTVFDTPTPAGLAARLVEQFRAEFDIDLDELDTPEAPVGQPDPAQRPPLAETVRPDHPPLSYSQAALWFQEQMRGPDEILNVALVLRFSGPLDTAALTGALNDVVARHEALRTNFVLRDGVPYQQVQPSLRIELPLHRISADDLESTVTRLRGHRFALDAGPLLDATVLQLDTEDHAVLLLAHHIVVDHASLGVIVDDLLTAYRSRLLGEEPRRLDDTGPPPQFADYATWQHRSADSSWAEAQLAHWRTVLAGLPDEIPLAHDRARPPVLHRHAEIAPFSVTAERRATLTEFAERIGVTEFMVYQGALAILLHALGGGTDIAVGSPVAARLDPATTNLVGPCANVVVLRNDLSGDPTVRDALLRGREVVLDAIAHQEVPTERVVEALNPPRTAARDHPLFQAAIQFRGEDWAAAPRTVTAGTTVTAMPMEFDRALLDLTVALTATPEGQLDGRVVGNADLYRARTVAEIAQAWTAVLDSIVAEPDRSLADLQLLLPATMERLRSRPATTEPAERPRADGSEETTRTLIELLAELLEIPDADIDRGDNFFALGGDSVISVQWAARAAAHGLRMTPAMVFEHLTIAELAAAIDAEEATGSGASADAAPASEPMSASGLAPDALAALTTSWQQHSQETDTR